MYGVPQDLDLTPFVGTTLDSILIGKHQIQFIFSGDPWATTKRAIAVEGRWEMRDAQHVLIDSTEAHDERETYKVHRLLGKTVSSAEVVPPESFSLIFRDGCTLAVVDDSSQYECCHVYIGDREIHI